MKLTSKKIKKTKESNLKDNLFIDEESKRNLRDLLGLEPTDNSSVIEPVKVDENIVEAITSTVQTCDSGSVEKKPTFYDLQVILEEKNFYTVRIDSGEDNTRSSALNDMVILPEFGVCLNIKFIYKSGWDRLLSADSNRNRLVQVLELLPEASAYEVEFSKEHYQAVEPVIVYRSNSKFLVHNIFSSLAYDTSIRESYIDFNTKDITKGLKALQFRLLKDSSMLTNSVVLVPEFLFYATANNSYEYQPEDITIILREIRRILQDDNSNTIIVPCFTTNSKHTSYIRGIENLIVDTTQEVFVEDSMDYTLEDLSRADFVIREKNDKPTDYSEDARELDIEVSSEVTKNTDETLTKIVFLREDSIQDIENVQSENCSNNLYVMEDSSVGVLSFIKDSKLRNMALKKDLGLDLQFLLDILVRVDCDFNSWMEFCQDKVENNLSLDYETVLEALRKYTKNTLSVSKYYKTNLMDALSKEAILIQENIVVGNYVDCFVYEEEIKPLRGLVLGVVDINSDKFLHLKTETGEYLCNKLSVYAICGLRSIFDNKETVSVEIDFLKVIKDRDLRGVLVDIETKDLVISSNSITPFLFINFLKELMQVKCSRIKELTAREESYYSMLESAIENLENLVEKL